MRGPIHRGSDFGQGSSLFALVLLHPSTAGLAAPRLPADHVAMTDTRWSPRTLAAQALGRIDEATRALVPPIHVTTTFLRDSDNQYRSGNIYGRADNQTVREAEAVIAALEDAEAAMLLGSGMSAATAVFLALAPGDHVVAPRGDVLGAAQLAAHRRGALGPERRGRGYLRPRRVAHRRAAGKDQTGLAGDPGQPVMDHHRHRIRRRRRA